MSLSKLPITFSIKFPRDIYPSLMVGNECPPLGWCLGWIRLNEWRYKVDLNATDLGLMNENVPTSQTQETPFHHYQPHGAVWKVWQFQFGALFHSHGSHFLIESSESVDPYLDEFTGAVERRLWIFKSSIIISIKFNFYSKETRPVKRSILWWRVK